ncbi:hypothetical protein UPYG_G00063750 [Umbra pygmaea]|uniref:Transposable element P transposase-like RNase H C-terminal domain-containing protein n=1 Tax=Umbra pygmaea TaxID=75934 RepID=A0ABD0XD77_UMBPY
MMIPELLEGQRYVCTYRLSQDHLELFFNSIRASGGWNNNPTVAHFQSYFRAIMVRCGIAPGKTGNAQAQDDTMCLSAVDMSSVVPAEDDDDNIASSPFEQITGNRRRNIAQLHFRKWIRISLLFVLVTCCSSCASIAKMPEVKSMFREVLPKQGQLSMEDVPTMVLCKPKLLPLKSVTLEKLEKMQLDAQEAIKQQELSLKQQQMPQ